MTKDTTLTINQSQVEQHLKLLDSNTDKFLFAAFDDDQDRKEKPITLYGSLNEHIEKLVELNQAGYGIFVTVNQTQGTSRKQGDIVSYRAVWVENDSGVKNQYPVQPTFSVQTSPGKYHDYFKVNGLGYFQRIALQQKLVEAFNSDPNAADAARVLRLAGFYHQKKSLKKGLTGEPHLVSLVEPVCAADTDRKTHEAGELMAAFGLPMTLAELVKQNSKVEHEYRGLVSDLLSLRKHVINPDEHPVSDETLDKVSHVLSLISVGDEQQLLPVSGVETIKSTLMKLKQQEYQPRMQADALEVLDQIESVYKDVCCANPPLIKQGDFILDTAWSEQTIRETQIALSLIDSDDRDDWVKVGHALKNDFGDAGFQLWDEWSQNSEKYDQRTIQKDWDSFNPKSVSKGTIFYLAQRTIDDMVKQAQEEGRL